MSERIRAVIQMFIDGGRETDALAESARWGEFQVLKDLLARGIPIDARAGNGATALMHAASGGQVRIVRYLLGQGADPNANHDTDHKTPIMDCLAAIHSETKCLEIIQLLLDAGVDPTLQDSGGRDALDYARERKSDKVVDLLKSKMGRSES